MTLKQWTINFVKNKDLFLKSLKDCEEESENKLVFHFKDKDQKYLLVETLDDSSIEFLKDKTSKRIVCQASMANRDFLIKHWKDFSSDTDLSIIFVRLVDHAKWLINPHVHSKICDDEALKTGLESMYSAAFQI